MTRTLAISALLAGLMAFAVSAEFVNQDELWNKACAGEFDPTIMSCPAILLLSTKEKAIAFANRGRAYFDKGEYDRTIDNTTLAIELDPKLANGFAIRGTAFAAKREYDSAITDLTSAIELDPMAETYVFNRAGAYANKHDLDRAIADYTRAIELDPTQADAFYDRGITYVEKGDRDRAIAAGQVPPMASLG